MNLEGDTAPNFLAQIAKGVGIGGLGTNEETVNSLFKLDDASLRKVDRELTASYPGGLRAFINDNYGGNGPVASNKTNDLFTKINDTSNSVLCNDLSAWPLRCARARANTCRGRAGGPVADGAPAGHGRVLQAVLGLV